jgi:hypothetical protein
MLIDQLIELYNDFENKQQLECEDKIITEDNELKNVYYSSGNREEACSTTTDPASIEADEQRRHDVNEHERTYKNVQEHR